jgi:alkylation response protein AidB-like acyl-CoA dehydrogenase
MELRLSPADLAFREEVRAFLAARLTPDLREATALNTATFCDLPAIERWHRVLYEKGWAAPAWPTQYGGPGWSEVQRYIFASECATAGAPSGFGFGAAMCGPVIMRFGTEAQKAHYLPRILSAEDRWCQGYSEPGAGSDLASLQTKAVADGDDYLVTGSKIWTTFAHNANRMFCLVRTDPDVKPQRGITFLLIDMATPGISLRPIVNIAGDHEFNQVFFDGARVPKANRVGDEGEGWTIAKYLLEFERGGAYAAALWTALSHVKTVAREAGIDDSGFRTRLADAEIEVRAVEMLEHRTLSALSLGQSPGPAASVLKLRGSETTQRIDELMIEAVDGYVAPRQPDALKPGNNETVIGPKAALTAMARYLYDRSVTIFGGTSEIQRNIVARAILGL